MDASVSYSLVFFEIFLKQFELTFMLYIHHIEQFYLFYGCTIILNSLNDILQTALLNISGFSTLHFLDFYTVLGMIEKKYHIDNFIISCNLTINLLCH